METGRNNQKYIMIISKSVSICICTYIYIHMDLRYDKDGTGAQWERRFY